MAIEQGLPRIIQKSETQPPTHREQPLWARTIKENGWLPKKIILTDPLSYCAGVERSNDITDTLLDEAGGETVYLYHAPIHNETKLEEWEKRGGKVVNNIQDIPQGGTVLFSAHGVSPDVWRIAQERKLKGADATCPLVEKPHREVKNLTDNDYEVILVGKKGHDEVEGVLGIAPEKIKVLDPKSSTDEISKLVAKMGDKLGLRTQTTLAHNEIAELIDYIKSIRPDLDLPRSIDDICFATQNRQEAIIDAINNAGAEKMIIFGSDENSRTPSSNTIRQREVAESHGISAHIVESIESINPNWFCNINTLGISAGASADPMRIVEFLRIMKDSGIKGEQVFRATVAKENMRFAPARRFDFSK